MKTAIEPPIPAWTTDELTHRLEHGYPSVERLAAAAMLRTQAAEIESLRKMLVISDDTHQTWMKANAPGGWIDDLRKENEALKAALNAAATSLNTISRLAGNEFYVFEDGERVETCMKHPEQIRGYAQSRYSAAIDAMKGKS